MALNQEFAECVENLRNLRDFEWLKEMPQLRGFSPKSWIMSNDAIWQYECAVYFSSDKNRDNALILLYNLRRANHIYNRIVYMLGRVVENGENLISDMIQAISANEPDSVFVLFLAIFYRIEGRPENFEVDLPKFKAFMENHPI